MGAKKRVVSLRAELKSIREVSDGLDIFSEGYKGFFTVKMISARRKKDGSQFCGSFPFGLTVDREGGRESAIALHSGEIFAEAKGMFVLEPLAQEQMIDQKTLLLWILDSLVLMHIEGPEEKISLDVEISYQK